MYIYNVFYPFLCSILPLYVCIHFSVSTVTCTFVTCFIKYQSINQSVKCTDTTTTVALLVKQADKCYTGENIALLVTVRWRSSADVYGRGSSSRS